MASLCRDGPRDTIQTAMKLKPPSCCSYGDEKIEKIYQPESLVELAVHALFPSTVSKAIQNEYHGRYLLAEDIKDRIEKYGGGRRDDVDWSNFLSTVEPVPNFVPIDPTTEAHRNRCKTGLDTGRIIHIIHMSGHNDQFMNLRYRPPCCADRETQQLQQLQQIQQQRHLLYATCPLWCEWKGIIDFKCNRAFSFQSKVVDILSLNCMAWVKVSCELPLQYLINHFSRFQHVMSELIQSTSSSTMKPLLPETLVDTDVELSEQQRQQIEALERLNYEYDPRAGLQDILGPEPERDPQTGEVIARYDPNVDPDRFYKFTIKQHHLSGKSQQDFERSTVIRKDPETGEILGPYLFHCDIWHSETIDRRGRVIQLGRLLKYYNYETWENHCYKEKNNNYAFLRV